MNLENVVAKEPLVLVDFYATWCGPCMGMMPTLEQLEQDMGTELKIMKVDIDVYPQVVTDYRIMGVPTFILYRGGKLVWQKPGTFGLAELKQMIALP